MPVGSEYENTNRHDVDASISIGLGTAGAHTTATSGVAIGQNVYGGDTATQLPLESSVLIGTDIFPGATSSHSIENSIVIGSGVGSSGVPGQRNVIVGSDAATDFSLSTDTVILGYSAANRAIANSEVVLIGGSAGRKHRLNDENHTIGYGSVLIGKDSGRNTDSADVQRTIGTNSTLLNTGAFLTADQDPTADTIAIGRGSLSLLTSGGTTGQICIGGVHHKTAIIDTDTSITLRTDSLNNITTTPTSTTISNIGSSDTHSTTLQCGSVSSVVHTRLGVKITDAALQTNRYITDHNGRSFMAGSSYWKSGRSDIATPDEVRRMVLSPNTVLADDDTASRSIVVFDGQSSDADGIYPSQHSAIASRMLGGTRVATNDELYVYFPRPPSGWKAVGCRLQVFSSSNLSESTRRVEIFSRKWDTSVDATPTNSDHLTIHVNQSLNRTTCTDITFTVPWIPSTTAGSGDYLVGYISTGSSANTYMGGYMDIERV